MTPEASARRALARWYGPRRLRYPWRLRSDPYRVLVSEIMLQQTQVSRVGPAYVRFVHRFPSVEALASATRADVLRAWAGLGYNRRAVALHEAARTIVREHGGRVPSEPDVLQRLGGVGPYTAAAVASLAFGVAVAAVDTNVRRVIARAALGDDDAPSSDVRVAAARWLDPADPAGWNQAVMDVGREICRARPRCEVCPLARSCRYRPRQVPAPPRRRETAFEGSSRQLRGRLIAELRAAPARTVASLSRAAGVPLEPVARAIRALAQEGLVDAGPGAIAGRPGGRVRLSVG
jgi:A/G-specific adenine glycosylase